MKKILWAIGVIAVLSVAAYFLLSKEEQKFEAVKINPGFSEYISGYTSGVISSGSAIRVRLSSQIKQEVKPGSSIKGKLFSFQPKIDGKGIWVDQRTLEFRPNAPLKSGQIYKGSFLLNKLVSGIGKDFASFPLQFQIIRQGVRISKVALEPYTHKELKKNKLKGELATADIVDNNTIETMVNASLDGKPMNIKWSHFPSTRKHTFTIDSIVRSQKDKTLVIEYDGSSFNIDVEGEKEVIIPSINSFRLMKMVVLQQPEQHVEIHFSDPLAPKQDFRGLVTIEDRKNLRFIVDGVKLKVYPQKRVSGSKEVEVSRGIRSVSQIKLGSSFSKELTFEAIKPAVRLIGKGVIIPNSNGVHFPFQAVNLSAVDVKIIKIFEDNIAQFLQINRLSGDYQLKRVGRVVASKKVVLTSPNVIDYAQWNTFSLDLDQLIDRDPGAIYRIELSPRKAYSLYPCADEGDDKKDEMQDWDIDEEQENSGWDGIEEYYYDENYRWQDRDNPCKYSYYVNKKVSRNVLASDMGIIAKAGHDNKLHVAITDLHTTKPQGGVIVEIYNYQQQLISKQITDKEGMASLDYSQKPFLLIAKKNEQRGYLKLDDGSSLSLSMFDVSGQKVTKGIKGYIYGDRGVWRPGDTLFLSFILQDRGNLLPEHHPVTMELYNSRGQKVQRMVKTQGVDNFYSFVTNTKADAPTGNWRVKIKVGGAVFEKSLRIETVKPNRLKINIDFGKDTITALDQQLKGTLGVKWLHGAIARNLKARVNVRLSPVRTRIQRFSDFTFDDPTRKFETEEQTLFDSKIDDKGEATFAANMSIQGRCPGMLKATFVTRVFEEGGDYSIDQMQIPYAPYNYFVGVKPPKGDKARGMLLTDKDHKVMVATVDANGRPVARRNLEVMLYKVNWRWWWQSGPDDLASYSGSRYHTPLMSKKISTNSEGVGEFDFKIKYPDWGRYLIRVKDPSGHSTGKTVYVDWPGWAGRAQGDNPGAASMLVFSADKKQYKVGETVRVTFPGSKQGRALVSMENGSRVIGSHWVETHQGENVFEFKTTAEMTPTLYVNITLLQPHGNTVNDLPIRLYGVIPLRVEDPSTRLKPVLEMPDELSSEQEVKVVVKEKTGRAMTYTLAMVDEGLLDLTRFKTPDPWVQFFKREALGIKTWDIFDMVLGAYGGQIENVFAIGGDEELMGKGKKKANRFKPVVKFLGPYHLKKNGKAVHHIQLPKYIGSVRTMVVAGADNAYGSTQKATPVKSPLMLLSTLPRVLSPSEEVTMPVTVFAMDKRMKDVKLQVKSNDLFEIVGGSQMNIHFDKTGDKDAVFTLRVKAKLGIAKVKVLAQSGEEKAEYEMELDIRAANPPVRDVYSAVIPAGESWSKDFKTIGIDDTNSAMVDVANIPPVDFGRRLKYLIQYPHGCIEQTTSAVFPQLFLDKVMEIDDDMKDKLSGNIQAGINRLTRFQLSDGGLSYWPGRQVADAWGTSYAGHFMLEAQSQGYTLPSGFISRWTSYQQREANNWRSNGEKRSQLIQAYRLYTLALAGNPEIGAMNRLRETKGVIPTAMWRLAAAYVMAGKPEIAQSMTDSLALTVADYRELSYTYGSSIRDEAMILETLVLMKDNQRMVPLIEKLSGALSSKQWMSTQTTAYSLVAFSKLLQGDSYSDRELNYDYNFNGVDKKSVRSDKNMKQHDISLQGRKKSTVTIKNNSQSIMYATLVVEGVPVEGDKSAASNLLNMKVVYKTLEGEVINPESITQGSDFKAEVTVKNPGTRGDYKEMALTQMFPSGWEIHNTRMFGGGSVHDKDVPTYRDIRDDRVYDYFDLRAGESKTFVVILNAAYRGKFYLPTISCEAMYDNRISARVPGRKVEVKKSL